MPLVPHTGADPDLSYDDFLREKVSFDRSFGFEIDPTEVAATRFAAATMTAAWTPQHEQIGFDL